MYANVTTIKRFQMSSRENTPVGAEVGVGVGVGRGDGRRGRSRTLQKGRRTQLGCQQVGHTRVILG